MGYLINKENINMIIKVLKTQEQRSESSKIGANAVPNDIIGRCACGCTVEFKGRKTKKWDTEACKQRGKRAIQAAKYI